MRRREFILALGGAASWPVAARAQRAVQVKRIAVLMGTAEDADGKGRLAAFRQGLQELNWVENRNVHFDIRWGAGDAARTKAFATELVEMTVRLDEGILYSLFRILDVSEHSQGYAKHAPLMFSHEGFKSPAISSQHQLDQSEVILAACVGGPGVFGHRQP